MSGFDTMRSHMTAERMKALYEAYSPLYWPKPLPEGPISQKLAKYLANRLIPAREPTWL